MFALGICFCIYNVRWTMPSISRRKFAKKPAVAEANVLALKGGYNYASNTHAFANTYVVRPGARCRRALRSISGNQATAWGLMGRFREKRPAAFLRLVSDHAGYGYSRGIGQAEGSERQDASGRGRDIGHLHGHRSLHMPAISP